MEKEVKTAVDWWSEQLGGRTKQDNGDAKTEMFHMFASADLEFPTEKQLATFRDSLTKSLMERLPDCGWDVDNPGHGSCVSGRCLAVDYHPDLFLRDAANDAGIDRHMLRFPMKSCMWISPGSVKVRHGYSAGDQEIFAVPDTINKKGLTQ